MDIKTRRFTTSAGIALATGAGLVMWAILVRTLMWAVTL